MFLSASGTASASTSLLGAPLIMARLKQSRIDLQVNKMSGDKANDGLWDGSHLHAAPKEGNRWRVSAKSKMTFTMALISSWTVASH